MRVFHFLAGAALIATACHNASAPALGTVYVLRSIESIPLPAPWAENRQLANRMFADTLFLADNGKGAWHLVVEDSFDGPKRHSIEEFTYTGTTHIEISFSCPPFASCIASPHLVGDVTGNGITFSLSRVSRAPLVFERIGGAL